MASRIGARTQAHDIPKYENDLYPPKLRAFAVLARVFGISMETLLYGEDEAARIEAEREPPGADRLTARG